MDAILVPCGQGSPRWARLLIRMRVLNDNAHMWFYTGKSDQKSRFCHAKTAIDWIGHSEFGAPPARGAPWSLISSRDESNNYYRRFYREIKRKREGNPYQNLLLGWIYDSENDVGKPHQIASKFAIPISLDNKTTKRLTKQLQIFFWIPWCARTDAPISTAPCDRILCTILHFDVLSCCHGSLDHNGMAYDVRYHTKQLRKSGRKRVGRES